MQWKQLSMALLRAGASRRRLVPWLGLFLALLITAPAAVAADVSPFAASFSGSFAIAGDAGASGIFLVEEAGSGTEEVGLGAFTYSVTDRQNLARTPPGCGSVSSTGAGGVAVLVFADGQLRLHRSAGTVCFAFPTIHVEEHWVIASGTGRFTGASGTLERLFDGDVRSGTVVGTIQGTLKMN